MASPGKYDLTTGAIGPALLKFAVPTLLSSVLQTLQGSINAIWVGRFLGEQSLAATTNANMILFLSMSFVFGFGMAATILIGQSYGRRDIDTVRRTIGTVLGGFAAISILISLVGWIFAPQILALMGVPPEATAPALAYLRVIFVSLPFGMTIAILTMALRGVGDAMTPMWIMAAGLVIDCGLNPILIAGLGPIPAMGIAGSATASVIANLCCLVAVFFIIYRRDLPIRLRGREFAYLKPDTLLAKRIVAMGLPMGLQMIVMSIALIVLQGLVNREGVNTTAAFGVAMQLWSYIQMPAMALSAAVSTMAAQNIGAGRWDRIGEITNKGILYNFAITGPLVVLLAVADRPALALFLGGASPALPIAEHIQLMGTWGFLLTGVTFVYFGTVRANGAVWAPLIILCISMIPVRLGFAELAYPWLGADAIWLASPISSTVSVVLAALYYRFGDWKKPNPRLAARAGPDIAIEEAAATMEPEGRMNPAG